MSRLAESTRACRATLRRMDPEEARAYLVAVHAAIYGDDGVPDGLDSLAAVCDLLAAAVEDADAAEDAS